MDSYSFGVQAPNTSIARWPDGTGSFIATTNATPGMQNKPNGYTIPPLVLTLEIVRGLGVKIFFPAGYQIILQCKGRLDEPAWIEVRGPHGYDAVSDRAWLLDPTAPDSRQRFYRAQLAR